MFKFIIFPGFSSKDEYGKNNFMDWWCWSLDKPEIAGVAITRPLAYHFLTGPSHRLTDFISRHISKPKIHNLENVHFRQTKNRVDYMQSWEKITFMVEVVLAGDHPKVDLQIFEHWSWPVSISHFELLCQYLSNLMIFASLDEPIRFP